MSPVLRLFRWLGNSTAQLLLMAIALLLFWGMLAPVGTLVWWITEGSETSDRLRQRLLGRSTSASGSASTNPSSLDSSAPVTGSATQSPESSSPALEKTSTDRSNSQSNSARQFDSRFPSSGSSIESSSGSSPVAIDCYIVFLTGVGDYSTDQLTSGEELFLDRLEQSHPNCVSVRDVFPYSAANQDLSAGRWLSPVWQAAEEGKGWLKNADILIKVRNLWRFAISADDRYGSIYNQGIAQAMLDRMNTAHPMTDVDDMQILLIGTSGGVQVALGAVPYLKDWLDVPVTVISAGGAFEGTAGFQRADQVYHLYGERDWVAAIPYGLFPSRWPITVGSPLNQARQQGRYRVINAGPHSHDGEDGYFGLAIEPQSQQAYVELTLQLVNQLPVWSAASTQ